MVRKLLMVCALGCSVIGMTVSVGCTKPGAVVQGKASNNDFAENSETDQHGREAPTGTGIYD